LHKDKQVFGLHEGSIESTPGNDNSLILTNQPGNKCGGKTGSGRNSAAFGLLFPLEKGKN
jgi:hypothetical protein